MEGIFEGMQSMKKNTSSIRSTIPVHIAEKLKKLYGDNLHHIKARDLLKDAIQAAINNPAMTPEVKETAELFILLLEETGNSFKYDADAVTEPIKKIVEEDTKKQQAKKAANAKHAKTNANKEKIRNIWASGKYADRETCADEEWNSLGFGSRKTARNALTNIPAPSPWPAKEIKKK